MRVSSDHLARVLAILATVSTVVTVFTGHPALISTDQPDRETSAKFDAYPGVTVLHDIVYERTDGVSEHLDVCLPATPATHAARPAIIEIHGGSWAYEDESDPDWQDACQWLASIGYVTANVDYRLAPLHPFPAGIDDVERAVEWMRAPTQTRRFAINPALIGAFGGSAGGNLAALLGTLGSGSTAVGHRVAAVAEMSGPIDLRTVGIERPDFSARVLAYLSCDTLTTCPQATAASPNYHVDASDPPFFISNSTDELIPLEQSADFAKTLRAAGVPTTFVAIPGQAHSIAGLSPVMRQRIAAFFHATLPLPTPRGGPQ